MTTYRTLKQHVHKQLSLCPRETIDIAPVPAPCKCSPVGTPEPAPRQRTPEPAPRLRTPEPAPRQRTPEPAPLERSSRGPSSVRACRAPSSVRACRAPSRVCASRAPPRVRASRAPPRVRAAQAPPRARCSPYFPQGNFFWGGSRAPAEETEAGAGAAVSEAVPPWPPKLPDPPWPPKFPIRRGSRNGRRPGGLLSCLRVPWGLQSARPPPLPVCYCYGAGRTYWEGGVRSGFWTLVSLFFPCPSWVSLFGISCSCFQSLVNHRLVFSPVFH